MFNCSLCHVSDEYCTGLCSKCEKIENLIRIYRVEKVVEILEKVLVAKQFKVETRTTEEIEKTDEKKEEDVAMPGYPTRGKKY